MSENEVCKVTFEGYFTFEGKPTIRELVELMKVWRRCIGAKHAALKEGGISYEWKLESVLPKVYLKEQFKL